MSQEREEIPILHIYAQPYYHEEAVIAGNAEGLRRLRDALDAALSALDGRSKAEAMPWDGECYEVMVLRLDWPWPDQRWRRLVLPYTDPDAADARPDTIHPGTIWDQLEQAGDARR